MMQEFVQEIQNTVQRGLRGIHIDRWEKSNDTEEKRDLLAAIGEIGVDVHNRNRQLGIL